MKRWISKRQFILYVGGMMKKGKVLGKKTMNRLMLQHYEKEALREYEFSCSSSPIHPAFLSGSSKQRPFHFPFIPIPNFSCIDITPQDQVIEKQKQKQNRKRLPSQSEEVDVINLMSTDSIATEASIRVSNCSLMEEGHEQIGGWQVDVEAEKFIQWFYEQLRVQGCTSLEHLQEKEYQEMLARGV